MLFSQHTMVGIHKFSLDVIKLLIWGITGNFEYLCFLPLNSSSVTCAPKSCFFRQGEGFLSWGKFLWLNEPYFLLFFAQIRDGLFSQWDWKSFWARWEAVDFATSILYKVKKKLFCTPISDFGYKMKFLHWHYYRC